jgi:hypothetical protein
MTSHPSLAKESAMALPIPLALPVTNATFSCSNMPILLLPMNLVVAKKRFKRQAGVLEEL